MPGVLKCISPVDGSVYAASEVPKPQAAAKAVEDAKAAQLHWAVRSLEERIRLVLGGVELVGAANKEAVPELAWQMGRPIR